MRSRHFVAVLFALTFALPAAALAQISIVPQVGLYAPLSELPSLSEAGEVGDRESTLAYGLALVLGDDQGPAFRLGVLRGTDSEVPVGGVGCEGEECARSTLTSATATVLFRLIDTPVVRPYILAGGGLRRLDFEYEEGVDTFFDDESAFAGHLGLGLEIDLLLLNLSVELSDVISSYEMGDESELQHDMFLMVGLGIG